MNIISTPKTDQKQSSNNYHRVIVQDDKWRVIVYKDSIQWVLQRRRKGGNNTAGVRWDAVSYCVTQKALDRLWRQKTGEHSPVLNTLPKTINARALRHIQKANKLTPNNTRGAKL